MGGNDVTIELDQSNKQKHTDFLEGKQKRDVAVLLMLSFLNLVKQWIRSVIIAAYNMHAIMKWIFKDLDKHNFKMQIIYLPNWATHLKLEFDPFHPSLRK